MKVSVVTTFSDAGFQEYGKNFIESCKKFLSKDITVYAYVDTILLESQENFVIRNLEDSIPDLTIFKNKNKHINPTSFLQDAVRFSHKSYCLYHAVNNCNSDLLFWLDADTEIYNNIDVDYLCKFLPTDCFTSYLGRSNYSETGFLGFNLKHPALKEYFDLFKWYYDSNEIYNLEGQLDCHVYDATRLKLEKVQTIKSYNLSPQDVTKHHFNHVFSGFMIHYKGNRKEKRNSQLAKMLERKT